MAAAGKGPCETYVCDISSSTRAIINKKVRIADSLLTMQKATYNVSQGNDNFSGPSDRMPSNLRPGGRKGVAKKHNSFDRYLARKKGSALRNAAARPLIRDCSGCWKFV